MLAGFVVSCRRSRFGWHRLNRSRWSLFKGICRKAVLLSAAASLVGGVYWVTPKRRSQRCRKKKNARLALPMVTPPTRSLPFLPIASPNVATFRAFPSAQMYLRFRLVYNAVKMWYQADSMKPATSRPMRGVISAASAHDLADGQTLCATLDRNTSQN